MTRIKCSPGSGLTEALLISLIKVCVKAALVVGHAAVPTLPSTFYSSQLSESNKILHDEVKFNIFKIVQVAGEPHSGRFRVRLQFNCISNMPYKARVLQVFWSYSSSAIRLHFRYVRLD